MSFAITTTQAGCRSVYCRLPHCQYWSLCSTVWLLVLYTRSTTSINISWWECSFILMSLLFAKFFTLTGKWQTRIMVAVSQTTKLEYGLMGGKFSFLRFQLVSYVDFLLVNATLPNAGLRLVLWLGLELSQWLLFRLAEQFFFEFCQWPRSSSFALKAVGRARVYIWTVFQVRSDDRLVQSR